MEGALSLVALVAVVVSAGVITVAAHFRMDRATALRAWAHANGWHYTDHHPRPLEDTVLPRAVHGQHARSQHVLTGRRGAHLVTAFEHSHTATAADRRGNGRSRLTYRIVAVRTPGPNAELEIRRRVELRPATGDGVEPVDTVFDAAFQTTGSDATFTHAVLDQATRRWLLADSRSRSLPVRFSGDHVLTWAPMRLDPARALTAADYLIELVDRVPSTAWNGRTTGR
ncbi:hypothetical protein BJF83_13480 [Nocardiopsis sp. CNR-923]|uniref:hypothetical protein n=1 Tax=Nocardiopsis sp. CNR-923 TaxID=1904965 RepID=UPI00095BE345|nr:hypothetical protein [Nocardiopsis sp. CNR-923]OLT28945.1 hypothetical protein BJF83_13480 [Nocardiopsis sp. CNR-923]